MEKGNVIGLDYGTRRIGVASGNLEMKMAFPKEVIENKGSDFVVFELEKFCEKWGAKMIVVGLPLNMEEHHRESRLINQVRAFAKVLEERLEIKVELFDERLSSFEAEKLSRNLHGGNAKKDDALAAQIILQRYFDQL